MKRVLWQVTYLIGGVVCLIGAVEFLAWYMGWPLLPAFQQGWPAVGGLADPLPPTLYRLSFTLVHATVLSAYVAILIPPAICALVATRNRDTWVGLLIWLIAAIAVLFSGPWGVVVRFAPGDHPQSCVSPLVVTLVYGPSPRRALQNLAVRLPNGHCGWPSGDHSPG